VVTHVQEQEQTTLEDLVTPEHLPTSGSTCTTTLHFAHKSSANISRHQAIVTAMLSRSAVLPKSAAESMMASAVALIDISDSGFPPIGARVIFLPSKIPGPALATRSRLREVPLRNVRIGYVEFRSS
jgi:hypothetical protein